jgi:hypothetical protein
VSWFETEKSNKLHNIPCLRVKLGNLVSSLHILFESLLDVAPSTTCIFIYTSNVVNGRWAGMCYLPGNCFGVISGGMAKI